MFLKPTHDIFKIYLPAAGAFTLNEPSNWVSTPATKLLSVFISFTVVDARGSFESASITLPLITRCAIMASAMVRHIANIKILFITVFYCTIL